MSSSDAITTSEFGLSSVTDQKIAFVLETNGAPYVQIQGKSTYSGTAAMVNIDYITKKED